MIDSASLQQRYAALSPELDERQRLLLAAAQASAAGYAGIAQCRGSRALPSAR
jgi:hypothetical protein